MDFVIGVILSAHRFRNNYCFEPNSRVCEVNAYEPADTLTLVSNIYRRLTPEATKTQ